MKRFKMAAFGTMAAAGLATAAFAQQPRSAQPVPNPPMDHQKMEQGRMGMAETMNDPEMRRQMTEMMSNCNRMMGQMGDMSNTGQTRR